MIKLQEVSKVGHIGKPHGIKGEVTMVFLSEEMANALFDSDVEYLILMIDGILVPFFWEEMRLTSKCGALFKFIDIETKEKAQSLTGCDVFLPNDILGNLPIEASIKSLIGFKVYEDKKEKFLGEISSIDDTTQNVLFIISTPKKETLLIPANKDLITKIDTQNHLLKVIIPLGLLEIND